VDKISEEIIPEEIIQEEIKSKETVSEELTSDPGNINKYFNFKFFSY